MPGRAAAAGAFVVQLVAIQLSQLCRHVVKLAPGCYCMLLPARGEQCVDHELDCALSFAAAMFELGRR
ncbi:MAG TPA: hypothetical protein VFA63_09655 [Pseudonocardiaceae bacterium]|nr:hypothetical protein [Pseudonocardiaceae bacterium]